MTTTLTRFFFPVLTLTVLQACGSTALDSDDLQAADEALGAEEEAQGEEPECAISAVCQLCDDGSCATPHVQVVDGECGPLTYTCDAASAGDEGAPTSSPPTVGQGTAPNAEGCPVPAICQLCDNGSCATPHVQIVDGECGPITYTCNSTDGNTAGGPVSSPINVPNCPVPAICQLCDDGTCATALVDYEDGECGPVHFVCGASVEGWPGPDAAVDAGADSGS